MPLWSLPEIDHGLDIIKIKRDAARAKGDLADEAVHQAWRRRLLDMRIVVAREAREASEKENA